jgi:hypothetical protein
MMDGAASTPIARRDPYTASAQTWRAWRRTCSHAPVATVRTRSAALGCPLIRRHAAIRVPGHAGQGNTATLAPPARASVQAVPLPAA